jgi:DNA repair exonuclease SbcCD ATPase subunit
VLVVELENIGGFIGRHRFEFREGLNEVIAPNAMGKTSLVKAIIAVYVPTAVSPEELLNYDANEGYIKLEVGEEQFVRRFRREGEKIVEVESKLVTGDDRIKYIVLDPQLGEVVKRLVLEMSPNITDYLSKVFRLDEYVNRIKNLESQIAQKERERENLRREEEDLKKIEEERRKLEEERARLARELDKLKKVSVERVRGIEDRIAELERRLGEIKSRIEDLEERLIPVTEERIKELQQEVERLRNVIREFYEHFREPDKYIEDIKERIKQVDESITKLKKELSEYLSGLDARVPVIKEALLSKASSCPICGAPIEKPEVFWSSRLQAVEEEVKKIKDRIIRDYEERIGRLSNERLNLWRELEEVTRKYNDIREMEVVKLPKYLSELTSATKTLESYRRELVSLKETRDNIVKDLESLKQQLSEEERRAAERRGDIERRLGEVEQRIKDLEEAIVKKSEAGRKLIKLEEEVKELMKELERTKEEYFSTLAKMKDEFVRIALEVIRELDFTWLKAIRLVEAPSRAGRVFEIRVVRVLPSGREVEQPLNTLSTSERLAIALVAILTGYRLRIFEEYRGLAPIIADEALLAFDPYRFKKVLEELRRYSKYVIATRLAEPSEVSSLTVVHKQ